MKIIKQSVILSIIVILTVIEVCGCGMKKEDNSQSSNEIIYEMKRHLEQKYGYIDYEVKGFIGGGWDHPYDVLNLSTTINGIEEGFSVERHDKDGEIVFEDNYFGLLIRDEFEAKVSEIASEYFTEYMVDAGMKSNNYPNSLGAESDFEDFLELKDEIGHFTFIVIVNETFATVEEFNEAAAGFVEDWRKVGITSTPRVIYIEKDIYKTIERDNYGSILWDNITEYSPKD